MLKRFRASWLEECDTLPTGETADEARRIRTLRALLLIILAIVNLFSLPLALSSAKPVLTILLAQPINLTILLAFILLRRQRINPAVVLFLLGVWISTTSTAYLQQDGVSSLAVCGYLLVILAAGLFLGLRRALFFTLLSTVSLVGLHFGGLYGRIKPGIMPEDPQGALLIYGMIFISGLVLIGTAITGMQSALRRAQSHQTSLREKNVQLQELLNSLEQRIHDRAGVILEQKQFYEALVENSPIAIVSLDGSHCILSCNPAFQQLFGYTREETLGANLDDLLAAPVPWHEAIVLTRQALAGQTVRATGSRRRKDGSLVDVDIYGVPVIVNGSQIGILGMYHDITERVQAESHLKYLATHDPLTDLSNRAMFYDHMEHALAMARRNQQRVAVLFLDLDGFKAVNDLLGHSKGDVLLQQVADWLKTTLRSSDLLVRLGGDEFAFVLEGIHAPEDVAAIAGKILQALEKPYLVQGQASNQELTPAYDRTLEGWAQALEMRDEETEGHSQRVTDLALRLARRLGMKPDELVHVRRGTTLHDIDKMGIPDSILLKPGSLTPEEWEIMNQHPLYAFNLLSSIPFLEKALDIPYCHHEKWDGSRYPRGLSGEQIPLAARVFALGDVWDALLSDRPYRPAWPRERALAYLQEQAGQHFDPRVVEAFLSMMVEEEKLPAPINRRMHQIV